MDGKKLTHLDEEDRLKMVDVGDKERTDRAARVRGEIRMEPETAALIAQNRVAKGNVLEAARLAGIMAAKRTGDLIPLCHPLNITAVDIEFTLKSDRVEVEAQARINDRTGVEMEALTAVTTACLTVYDMVKAVEKSMIIEDVRLVLKDGGKSGRYEASK